MVLMRFQAPPEPLPAEDSMSQFALLLWFSVVLGLFFCFLVTELCLRKLCFLLYWVQLLITVFGVDVLVLLLVSAQGLPLLPPALTVCISVAE